MLLGRKKKSRILQLNTNTKKQFQVQDLYDQIQCIELGSNVSTDAEHIHIEHTTNIEEEKGILQTKVESLEHKLNEKEEEIKMLTQQNTIAANNFKAQLENERKKFAELCQKQNGDKQNGSSVDLDCNSGKLLILPLNVDIDDDLVNLDI